MKSFYYLWLFSLMVHAENYELKYFKDKSHIAQGIGIHSDLGYSSYLIELHSSEIDSAIDYDVLEFTLGASYSYDKWLFAFYSKFLVNEIESNMYVLNSKKLLNNHAQIDKNEFAIYGNYTFYNTEVDRWNINLIYRYASLDAVDSYHSFLDYRSDFSYQTDGLALSLSYLKQLTQQDTLLLNGGVVYNQVKVHIVESVNGELQDSFVNDTGAAIGRKISIAYNRKMTNHLSLTVRFDGWKHKFNKLNVSSRVGDHLPSARLKEESYSSYAGFGWRF